MILNVYLIQFEIFKKRRNWILVISFQFWYFNPYLSTCLPTSSSSFYVPFGWRSSLIWPASAFRMRGLLRTYFHKICYKGISSVLKRFGHGKSLFYHLVLLSHLSGIIDFLLGKLIYLSMYYTENIDCKPLSISSLWFSILYLCIILSLMEGGQYFLIFCIEEKSSTMIIYVAISYGANVNLPTFLYCLQIKGTTIKTNCKIQN